jgi:hypothetical protein
MNGVSQEVLLVLALCRWLEVPRVRRRRGRGDEEGMKEVNQGREGRK